MKWYSQTIYEFWTQECLEQFGYVLPINNIRPNAVLHEVRDDEEPLRSLDGKVMRTFKISYDLEEVLDEQRNIN